MRSALKTKEFIMKLLRTLLSLLLLVSAGAFAQSKPHVEVYKSASCGCCGAWVDHLKENGFDVKVNNVDDVSAERKQLGMPERLAACHTAKVGNYLIEGHVTAADIQRLLKEKPRALGIAVPSMPPGAPGMPSAKPIPYNTLLVATDGSTQVYTQH